MNLTTIGGSILIITGLSMELEIIPKTLHAPLLFISLFMLSVAILFKMEKEK